MSDATEQRDAKEQRDKGNGRSKPAEINCPLAKSTNKLQGLTKEMKDLLKQIRRDMGACNHCELKSGCEVRAEFAQIVREALVEVAQELKLASYD
jgi:hypothetical protein